MKHCHYQPRLAINDEPRSNWNQHITVIHGWGWLDIPTYYHYFFDEAMLTCQVPIAFARSSWAAQISWMGLGTGHSEALARTINQGLWGSSLVVGQSWQLNDSWRTNLKSWTDSFNWQCWRKKGFHSRLGFLRVSTPMVFVEGLWTWLVAVMF